MSRKRPVRVPTYLDLLNWRKKAGLTQPQVAAHIGRTTQTYWAYENNKSPIPVTVWAHLRTLDPKAPGIGRHAPSPRN